MIEGRPPDDAPRGDDSGLGDADWRPKLPDPEPTELEGPVVHHHDRLLRARARPPGHPEQIVRWIAAEHP